LSGVTFKAAIGIGYTAPVDGKLTLTFTDDADATETTAELDAANLTAASIEASLNALASVVTAGGVTVREADPGFFVVTFNTAGARELLDRRCRQRGPYVHSGCVPCGHGRR
jgi:hypothetical protein